MMSARKKNAAPTAIILPRRAGRNRATSRNREDDKKNIKNIINKKIIAPVHLLAPKE
jgi:hypothetical protein